MRETESQKLSIDGEVFRLEIIRKVSKDIEVPKLVTVCYNATKQNSEITRLCLASIQKFTSEPYELWVVDNNSPMENIEWLYKYPEINIILNRTTPYKENRQKLPRLLTKLIGSRRREASNQIKTGSYANAIGLEIAAQVIEPESKYMMVMHNDILVCEDEWLGFLMSRLNDKVRGVAVSHDPSRVKAMHCSGFLFDFSLFRAMQMNFFPHLPEYDVGDLITIRLREAGYNYYICKNTFNHPETVDLIPSHHPLRDMYCDRVFDDRGRIIYLHLGRGTPKAIGKYQIPGKTYPEQWISFAKSHLNL